MTSTRSWAALASVGLAVSAATVASVSPASAAGSSARATLAGSLTPSSERAKAEGRVAAGASVSFDLSLSLRNVAAADALVTAVSTPGSAQYRHFVTQAQWIASFAPTQTAVASAESWLRSEGFQVGAVPADRLFIPATGSAAQVEQAFGTTLSTYKVNGLSVRLANSALSLPASIAGVVAGVVGVNQSVATNDLNSGAAAAASNAGSASQEPPPPAAFKNPQPCGSSFGTRIDTTDNASLYAPFTSPQPYDICGYKPAQLEGAYGLAGSIASGNNGHGVKIAVVDAYDSPTLLSDAQEYFSTNDPSIPLLKSQFTNMQPTTVDNQAECGGSGWYPEQALDVEAEHTMAPGAHIIFVGAVDCLDSSLLAAVNTAVTSGASVVSDSWGDTLGDLLTDAATKAAFDATFRLADSTGVSVLYSSGDDGDNFADFGLAAPDYPASSPYITAVGGTSLEVKGDTRTAEYGWSTAKQVLCEATTTNCGSATTPLGTLNWQAGGGAGTSYTYLQPAYQANVVPAALALKNENLFGPQPLRVIPDISMDADASTGMLIGLTQTFPNGTVKYSQFKEGGTSLASPLLAGVIADADQAAGGAIGFLNPTLYHVALHYADAFNDIVPATNPDATAVIRVDYANTVNTVDGYVVSLRAIDYQGVETYCDATGNCASRPVSVDTAPGFDGMTGIGSVGPDFIERMASAS
ncbi:MAG: S53 family peptidase [Candidatus Dormibacteria bacterium]|jgi:subtilase family serine protease